MEEKGEYDDGPDTSAGFLLYGVGVYGGVDIVRLFSFSSGGDGLRDWVLDLHGLCGGGDSGLEFGRHREEEEEECL